MKDVNEAVLQHEERIQSFADKAKILEDIHDIAAMNHEWKEVEDRFLQYREMKYCDMKGQANALESLVNNHKAISPVSLVKRRSGSPNFICGTVPICA